MKGQKENSQLSSQTMPASYSMNGRKKQNRRTHDCEGYYYLHTIGWVCRRSKRRRKTDPLER